MVHVDASKLFADGKLIQIRTHTRFVHFPIHTHNFVEMVYMCQGSTHHVINGKNVILKEGELLLIGQSATQEIYTAKETDVAVNFIILPEFFAYGLTMIEKERNQLHSFVTDCLTGGKKNSGYLHFKVSDVLPIQQSLLLNEIIFYVCDMLSLWENPKEGAYLLEKLLTQINENRKMAIQDTFLDKRCSFFVF